jgi:hypothetical protein
MADATLLSHSGLIHEPQLDPLARMCGNDRRERVAQAFF